MNVKDKPAFFRRPSNGVAAGDAIPFYHDGVYHLFYLATPPGTEHYPERVRCSWNHATTKNLLDWEELPTALRPGDDRNEPDADGVWTGSVIFAEEEYHIFYTGHCQFAEFPQTICHATSKDLVHFEKDPNNPILVPDTTRYEGNDWRDPYVFWNEEAGKYWMVLSGRMKMGPPSFRGCIVLATSTDLREWKVQDPIYAPFTTFCPECPELFKMDEKWYLIYSRFSESAQTIYRISDRPQGPWKTPLREGLDGRRWYAAKSLGDGKRRIAFGWVHEKEGATDDGIWEWGGDFCVPRELYPEENFEIAVKCPEEILEKYPASHPYKFSPIMGTWDISGSQIIVKAGDQLAYGFLSTPSPNYQFKCIIHPQEIQGDFGVILKATDNLETAHVVAFQPGSQRVSLLRWPEPLDRESSAALPHLKDRKIPLPGPDGPRLVERPIKISNHEEISCTILVSNSIVEVFINDIVSLTYRIYDAGDHELGLMSQGGQMAFKSIMINSI